jgi:hypothetical protein
MPYIGIIENTTKEIQELLHLNQKEMIRYKIAIFKMFYNTSDISESFKAVVVTVN